MFDGRSQEEAIINVTVTSLKQKLTEIKTKFPIMQNDLVVLKM